MFSNCCLRPSHDPRKCLWNSSWLSLLFRAWCGTPLFCDITVQRRPQSPRFVLPSIRVLKILRLTCVGYLFLIRQYVIESVGACGTSETFCGYLTTGKRSIVGAVTCCLKWWCSGLGWVFVYWRGGGVESLLQLRCVHVIRDLSWYAVVYTFHMLVLCAVVAEHR